MRMSILPGLVSVALAGFTVLALPGPALAAEGSPVAPTTSGRVLGTTESGVEVFRGIPYAAPPIGDRRWLPPASGATLDRRPRCDVLRPGLPAGPGPA